MQCGKLNFWSTRPKTDEMSLICSILNSTHPGQFSTRLAQNALALAKGGGLVSLTADGNFRSNTSAINHWNYSVLSKIWFRFPRGECVNVYNDVRPLTLHPYNSTISWYYSTTWYYRTRMQSRQWTCIGHSIAQALTHWPLGDATKISKCKFFVPRGPINNIATLVQIMVWHQSGDKPLSEPMMVRSLTHIWVTLPQWVNTHLGLYNITNILQTTFSLSVSVSWIKIVIFWFKFQLNFFPLLSKPVMAKCTVLMHIYASLDLNKS